MGSEPSESPNWRSIIHLANYPSRNSPTDSSDESYFPAQHPEGFWTLQAQLGATDVWLDLPDQVRIHGWFVDCTGSRRVTLFLHGNAGSTAVRVSVRSRLPAPLF